MESARGAADGFTLVELMTVVLIIGILVTIAVPVYTNARLDAQNKGCQSNQRTIVGAVDLLAAVDGVAPTNTAGEFVSGGSGWYVALVPDWIKSTPTCPDGGTNYYIDAGGVVTGDTDEGRSFKLGHRLQ